MANTVTKALLEKYIDHRCTPAEAATVEQYLQQPGAGAVLNKLLEERLTTDMEESMQSTDSEEQKAVWIATMRSRMGRSGGKTFRIWRYVAAGAAILFGAGVFSLYRINKPKQSYVALSQKSNPQGQRALIQLSDGSVVLLGAASKLEYPESFSGDKREISLSGEAFFQIADDPAHPFIVKTGNIETTVLGTSFRISAFNSQPLTVAVATGKVRVDHKENGQSQELAILTPGKQVIWADNHTALATVNIADIEGWQKGRLVFSNQSLQQVATELERWYNLKISFKHPKKGTEKITVTLFGSMSLDKTLQTLAAGSDFKYTVNGRDVLIY